MHIKVVRYNSCKDHTNSVIIIDSVFECYGIEDERREEKKYGETRISDGIYSIGFRVEGGFHNRYKEMFGVDFHRGMLQVRNVPNFENILIHIGNDDDDTSGCLLIGQTQSKGDNFVGSSKLAYKEMYPKVRDALLRGEEVFIQYTTIDK